MKKITHLLLIAGVFLALLFGSCAQPVIDSADNQDQVTETEDEILFNPETEFSAGRYGCAPLYFKFESKVSGQALTGTGTLNGETAEVVQFPWAANDSQMWQIQYWGRGYFKIVSRSTGQVLTVKEGSGENGAAVISQPWSRSKNQLWRISYAGRGYFKIRSKQGRFVLSVENGSLQIGAPVVQTVWCPWNTKAHQMWKIEKAQALPADWEAMEIESKWETDRETYRKIVDDFPEDGFKYGYKLNVRWKGIPKKFVDTYYDNANRTISAAKHAFRHRVRYASKPRAENDELETLENAAWEEDWQKVQYKGTASIIDAVWFRVERGNDKVNSEEAQAIISGENRTHDAVLLALDYTPDLDFSTMEPIMLVTDYRYRVEFLDENEDPVFELSLDRAALENLKTGGSTLLTEVELEIIKDEYTREDLEKLFELSYLLEKEYNITPSTKSKGEI